MVFGSTQRNKPSRFVTEIPTELTEMTRTRSWVKPTSSVSTTTMSDSLKKTTAAARSFGQANMAAKKPAGQFAPGDKVAHKAFGEGMILSATPMGNDTLLEVAFESEGTKKILANFARLKKL